MTRHPCRPLRSAPLTLLALGLVLGPTACGDGILEVTTRFRADLSGANEVPPVQTNASGLTTFSLTAGVVAYRIEVFEIENVSAAHIHSGTASENGPIVVGLFAAQPPVSRPQGVLVEGEFTAADVEGITFQALLDVMRTGGAYVNVHTSANPEGEIRGQVRLQE